jgi:hypothetical protein
MVKKIPPFMKYAGLLPQDLLTGPFWTDESNRDAEVQFL